MGHPGKDPVGVGAGGEHRAPCPQGPACGAKLDPRSGPPDRFDAAPLVDPNAEPFGLPAEAVHQLDRIQDPAPARPHAAQVERRVEEAAELLAGKPLVAVEPQAAGGGDRAPPVFHLARGEGRDQAAGGLVVAGDAAVAQPADHLADVGLAQRGEPARLGLAEVPDGEAVAVVHGLRQHAGVPSARPVGGGLALEDRHLGGGIELLEEERGPEPGEPGTHHGDVGLARAVEWDGGASGALGEPVAGALDRR